MTRNTKPRRRRAERGQVIVVVAVSLVALIAMAAFAVDIGYLVYAQRTLQASTDAAATAAAQDMPDDTKARTTATSYSSTAGNKNFKSNLPNVTITTNIICDSFLVSQSLPCVRMTSGASANEIVVTQSTPLPMMFARVLGITSLNVSATAKAGMRGGLRPLNIIVIVDTTASMADLSSSQDLNCGSTGVSQSNSTYRPNQLDCAKLGVRSLIGCVSASGPCNLNPSLDSVGLMTFPGLTSATPASRDYNCTADVHPTSLSDSTTSNVAGYNASPVYSIVPLLSDYRLGTSTTLNPASNLVKAVDWTGIAGCTSTTYGLEAPWVNGGGSFPMLVLNTYYAGAITAAQSAFPTGSTSGANKQNVIILLSDGDANVNGPNACQAGVTAATNAANAGTWVYSVAYGASNSGCSTDTGAYRGNACRAMQDMARKNGGATDSSKFYSDNTSCASTNSVRQMDQIFASIGRDLTTTRLVP